ncbi:MAG: hypothetical protein ACI31M_04840 [Bacilli bacterium]
MHKKVKNIIVLVVVVLLLSTLTVTAALVTSASNITFSSDKTEKTNVKEALDDLFNQVNSISSNSFSNIEEVYKGSITPININASTPNTVTFNVPKSGNLIIDINYDGGAPGGKYYLISASATKCVPIQNDLPLYNSTYYTGYLLAGNVIKGDSITVSFYAWNDAISSTYTISAYIIENEEEKQIENVYKNTFVPANITTEPKIMKFTASKTGNLIIDVNYDGGGVAGKYRPLLLKATHSLIIQNDLPIFGTVYSGYLMFGFCEEGEEITITLGAWNDAISTSYTVNAYII